MPELPEVETVVRELRPLLIGRTIRAVRSGKQALRFPWRAGWSRQVVGRQVASIARRGKWLLFHLSDNACLVGHLGMTGQMRVVPRETASELHTHLVFELDGGNDWRYRDVRRFGGLRWFPTRADAESQLNDQLGPEPWDLQPDQWRQELLNTTRSLKATLLDQRIVAGVGNIYADEALHRSGLSPKLRGCDATAAEAERLRGAIVAVLEQAIEARGSSIRDYIGGSGLSGSFQNELLVYGRAGEPCRTCGKSIVVVRLAGRSTHSCPDCQKRRGRTARRKV